MKKYLLLLALLVGMSDGSILVFPGSPLVLIAPTEITIDGVVFPVVDVKAMRYVPDNMVI